MYKLVYICIVSIKVFKEMSCDKVSIISLDS